MTELLYPAFPAPLPKGCKPERACEMLPLTDALGAVVGQAPRSWCHGGSKALHPVVHLHIINRNSQVYLQKRSASKKILPLYWDTAVGGHISYGEQVEEALYREAREELGMFDFNPFPLLTYEWESGIEKELVNVFAAVGDFALEPHNEEVEQGRWWSLEEIDKAAGQGILTPNFEIEFEKIRHSLLALL